MKYCYYAAGVLAALAATSCVDDKYDLSDIDTTAQIKVDDLTIPVNIDAVTLKSMFDLDPDDPDSRIKVVDGVYAVVESGAFTSENVNIAVIDLQGTSGTPTVTTITTGGTGAPGAGAEMAVPVTSTPVEFDFSSSEVPAEIQAIEVVEGAFTLSLRLEFPELASVTGKLGFRNLVIALPKGLYGTPSEGDYDAEAGTVTVASTQFTGGVFNLTVACTGIDYVKAGGRFDAATHHTTLEGDMAIVSGDLVINGSDLHGQLPSSFSLHSSVSLSPFTVTSFSGSIKYEIEGADFNDVTLDNLPDILAQEDTRITIMNPQIYLRVNNPLSPYDLKARTGMEITSVFSAEQGTPSHTISLDAPGWFEVSSAAESSYVLSPEDPGKYLAGFNNPLHVPFSQLSTVLDGNGLPKTLEIDLHNPNVYTQPVKRLPLGVNLGYVDGRYEFFAPLALGAGSQVVYTETKDGWNDEDVDALTIQALDIATTVSSDLPFELLLSGYPIDVNGRQIGNVVIEKVTVPAMAKDEHVVIRITGEITHLDGIVFTAKGNVPADMASPLQPTQSLVCKDVRATVSGYYLKEL